MQYSNSLFREEAIKGQHTGKLGNPLRLPSPQYLVVVCLLLFVTTGFIYLLITHTYTNKVSVVGWLVTEQASVDIYPIEQNSLLGKIAVVSEQVVKKGDVLAHLIRSGSQLSGEVAHHKQVASIQKQLSSLNKQIELHTQQHQQNLSQNEQLMSNLRAQLKTSKERLSHLENLLSLHATQETELYSLYKLGSVSKTIYHQS
jgi:membrane fusion protein